MSNIAIIPARGGSKRIPRKNIRDFLGKPIIAYSIQAALESKLFDEVMVSTDDEEIAEIAKSYGANVPFMRSADNANDHATIADVIEEVLLMYTEEKIYIENVCCILPTAPLISRHDIKAVYSKMLSSNFTAAYPIVEYSYPIMRSLTIDNQGRIKMRWPEYLTVRSQDIVPSYHDSGTFYWVRRDSFDKYKTILTPACTGVVVSETKVQDIDTESDWLIAEMKYKILYGSE